MQVILMHNRKAGSGKHGKKELPIERIWMRQHPRRAGVGKRGEGDRAVSRDERVVRDDGLAASTGATPGSSELGWGSVPTGALDRRTCARTVLGRRRPGR